ncbi:hypothetical protein PROFUN_05489 [Planoprotostelium fungivorum]|uniref:N-acetyltransferase domain-containing protein n=1 Tax=Planoprotostelium fungivorum TaxID=1890364 RepID=A0A2P6NR34_9EUKA|nr:hypothetical protein PROFUN_05489 [Planoprotostelium fungivorum]
MSAIETVRLQINKFTEEDAPFIIHILNDPGFINNIGDRGVRTISDARDYITKRITSFYPSGSGMLKITLKDGDIDIGMVGFVIRPGLEGPDLGFALLSEYTRRGYALEAARALLDSPRGVLEGKRLFGIVKEENTASIGLLKKLGFEDKGYRTLPGAQETLKLFEEATARVSTTSPSHIPDLSVLENKWITTGGFVAVNVAVHNSEVYPFIRGAAIFRRNETNDLYGTTTNLSNSGLQSTRDRARERLEFNMEIPDDIIFNRYTKNKGRSISLLSQSPPSSSKDLLADRRASDAAENARLGNALAFSSGLSGTVIYDIWAARNSVEINKPKQQTNAYTIHLYKYRISCGDMYITEEHTSQRSMSE